jgi:protein-S-isoprenylcysteine O-methyltransferase Ste14
MGFLLVAALLWLSDPTPRSCVAGAAIGSLGLLLRAWAAGHLAKNRELATSGPYAYLRNPLYAGTLIVAAGLAIASRTIVIAILFAIVFAFVYWPVVQLEEQHLRKLFPAYAQYAAIVPALRPTLRNRGSSQRFRWSLYLRNEEYQAFAGFIAGFAILLWKAA